MFSGCKIAALALCFVMAMTAAELRVCSDPDHLPFSNQKQQGFENEIAQLVARDLGRTVRYAWWPSREDFFKKTINAGRCDVVMAVPARFGEVKPTRPYYRSSYVFVWRRDRHLRLGSLNDPQLKNLRIGVHVVSDDSSNLPPAQALANRGLFANMVAYRLANSPGDALLDALIDRKIDVAIVWGPLAGYFAKHSAVQLNLAPVSPPIDRPYLPFTYEIAMGVRPDEPQLWSQLNGIIDREQPAIRQILERYGVPLLDYGAEDRP